MIDVIISLFEGTLQHLVIKLSCHEVILYTSHEFLKSFPEKPNVTTTHKRVLKALILKLSRFNSRTSNFEIKDIEFLFFH